MGFFTRILYGLTEFVRRNPVTCLVILILAVAAPSVLVGIANFIFYVMLTILLLGVVFVLLFRYRVNKLRREMGAAGRLLAGRPAPPHLYVVLAPRRRRREGLQDLRHARKADQRLGGRIRRVRGGGGAEPEKINLRRPNAVRSPG